MLTRRGAHLSFCFLLAGLTACGDDVSVAPPPDSAKSMEAATPSVLNRSLAYIHSVDISAKQAEVSVLFESARSACLADTTNLCTILEANINTGDAASARLRFRTRPAGILPLIASLSGSGKIVNRSTMAEDLAGPIDDAARRLSMLTEYRAKLEGLQSRASTDFDALIKVTHELAEVQSQIETLSGETARLTQRVETEILNVSISSTSHPSFWNPISLAFSQFGRNFSTGSAGAITAIAYLIPWAVVLFVLFWFGNRLRRGRRRGETV